VTDLRYPIGKFEAPTAYTAEMRTGFIDDIERTPAALRKAVGGLAAKQLDTPYRLGGWTVRQVVHHVPDSHLNAYVRTKLALTEDEPTIKPYAEARWAELIDGRTGSPETSLSLLEAVHTRWTMLLRSLKPNDHARTLHHPEHPGILTIDWILALYAWHGRHHVAHITSLREREGWR
jgi:DinB family protein